MKKIIWGVLAAACALLLGLGTQSANAASKYTVVKQKWNFNITYLIPKKVSKSVTIWNKKHTKKISNLKRVPNRTWRSTAMLTLKHGKTNAKYYRITGWNTKKTKSITGYVWHGFVKPGLAKDMLKSQYITLNIFPTTKDYANYIKYSPSQGITRQMLKLLPQSKLDLQLTRLAGAKYSYYYYDGMKPLVIAGSFNAKKYKNIKSFPKVTKYLAQSRKSATKTRIKKIKSILSSYGYSKSKLKSLKNYHVGLMVVDHTQLGSAAMYPDNDYSYAFVIAQKK